MYTGMHLSILHLYCVWYIIFIFKYCVYFTNIHGILMRIVIYHNACKTTKPVQRNENCSATTTACQRIIQTLLTTTRATGNLKFIYLVFVHLRRFTFVSSLVSMICSDQLELIIAIEEGGSVVNNRL